MKLRQVAATALIAAGASFAATAAHAEAPEAQPANSGAFRALDRNGDGFLTRAEVSHVAAYSKAFDEADDNRDGKLSPDEFIKADSIRERQLAGVYVADSTLTVKVKTALARDLELKSLDVHVMTDKGRVLLSGWVDNDAQRKKAYQVASRVAGVKLVRDGMTVR
jgi:hyperosmotically inducible protein